MFLPGRNLTDHIFSLGDEFYSKWRAGEEFFTLFTDNRKAFDSIRHNFILATLSKQGFSSWFILAVQNLLTDVWVSPSIAPGASINIKSGVKQG